MLDKNSYELTELAATDIENIALQGLQQFGIDQARQYHDGLTRQLERLSESPLQYPTAEGLHPKYRRCVYQKHSIYYIIEEARVLIVRVLGRQDIRVSLGHQSTTSYFDQLFVGY